MNTVNTPHQSFEISEIKLQMKLAALWASFEFLYIYVDYFHLFMPKKLESIQQGVVFEFDITQGFLLFALISVSIPAMMIVLSVVLKGNSNRQLNTAVATLYIPYTLFNLVGEVPWMHMMYGALVEVVLLVMILVYARQWTRSNS